MGQERDLGTYSNQAPQVASGGQLPTVQFSTSRASALQDLSRTLFGLAGNFQDQLDQQAEAEAQKEGALAGLAGNTEEQTYTTIRGRAYNKAMLETFVTTMDTQSMVETARLQQMYGNDPVRLEQALNDYSRGRAEEVDKIAPGAGAAMRQRFTARTLPAVEAARDTRFKLTREAAEASLLENEAALMGSIKNNAAGLFSDNPAMSAASSTSVAQTVSEYMRTYDAVDEVTGKPLFSAVDKAKARLYIRDKVVENATLSWFEAQPDKVAAYMKMNNPDFKFNLNIPGENPGNVIYATQGKKRSLPVTPDVMQRLQTATGAMGGNIEAVITSGGQVSEAQQKLALARGERPGSRTGSERHDHGNAADVVLRVNGRDVTPQENPKLYEQFLENAAAAGFTGIGHYSWGVHVGGGDVAAWGPSTGSETLDPAFGSAIERGRKSGGLKLMEPMNMQVPIKSAMSEAAFNRLDAEMRTRISFENTMADRERATSERQLKAEQDAAEVLVTSRIFAEGETDPATGQPFKPIDATEINSLVSMGIISPTKAEAFIKALKTEKPDKSDDATYREIQRLMFEGVDVQAMILNSGSKLSKTDAASLLSNNRSMNIEGAGKLSYEEQSHLNLIKDVLTPPTAFGIQDPNRESRRYEAEMEWRRRAKDRGTTGETLEEITEDIKGRATVDAQYFTMSAIGSLILPRYSVSQKDAVGRQVDIAASAKALLAKKSEMTEREYISQVRLLRKWDMAQKEMEAADRAASTNKKKGR